MLRALWHRLICVTFERNAIRETVEGVLGFRCGCGLWRPAMRRSERERATPVIAPAHQRYRVLRRVAAIRRRA